MYVRNTARTASNSFLRRRISAASLSLTCRSFAFLDGDKNRDKKLKKAGPLSIGEIYISVEKAEEQAKEYSHSLEREMSFLFVHGLLHLLGYDHMTEEDEKVMFKLQDEILPSKEK